MRMQVLGKALEVWGLTPINMRNPSVASSAAAPHLEQAFICNLEVGPSPCLFGLLFTWYRLPSPGILNPLTGPLLAFSLRPNTPLFLQEHWFTLRQIAGEWWNFNSMYPAPQPLGTFYLDAFLGTLRNQG